MGRVQGKVAIVTGASTADGLGFAAARLLLHEGARVVLTGTNTHALNERVSELSGFSGEVLGISHDVSKEADWDWTIERVLAVFGKLDILVNNAGITHRRPLESMSLPDWQRVIDVNLSGTFLGCRSAVAAMRRQGGGGSIVNVGSIGGLTGFAQSSAYGSSKGGVRQLSRVVAVESAQYNIRCNSIYPGVIRTGIQEQVIRDSPEHHQRLVASIPLGRLGTADEVANCILFLASDESKYVTGAELVVDGGLMA